MRRVSYLKVTSTYELFPLPMKSDQALDEPSQTPPPNLLCPVETTEEVVGSGANKDLTPSSTISLARVSDWTVRHVCLWLENNLGLGRKYHS